ncbi:MAG: HAD hydrolase-like protein [Lachnospiraceae bacterium]|nr:HAD hydrolase-like protein [Lachnospiraceae bacterium]
MRKPNKGGICYIADVFDIREAEILFVGDEEKDFLTARNAGCDFIYISDFLKNEKKLQANSAINESICTND